MANKDYRDLIVWQKAMDLTLEVYRLVKELPKEERYALSDQMRRAAVSIPSNIAEGQGRTSKQEFARFLSIAQGSRSELETQMLLCVKLGFLQEDEIANAMNTSTEVGRMLTRLIQSLTTNH